MREAGGNKPAGPGRGHDQSDNRRRGAILLLLAGGAYYEHRAGVWRLQKPVTATYKVEAERNAREAEQRRLEAAKAEAEEAKRGAEAEAKRTSDEEWQLQEVNAGHRAAVGC